MIHRLGRVDSEAIRLGRILSDSESAHIDSAIANLRAYFQRPELVLTVEMCDELKAAINRFAPGTPISLAAAVDPVEMVFWVASRLVLWLEAVRIFLNTTETRLKRTYGADTDFWKTWEYRKRDLFDTFPSYRLLYHLRNQAHQALPPIWFHSSSARLPSGEHGVLNEIALDPGQLLNTFEKWPSDVRQDLEGSNSVMPLLPLITEHQSNIERLGSYLMREERTEVVQDANLLRNLAREAMQSAPSGSPVVLHFDSEQHMADLSAMRVSLIDTQQLAWFQSVLQGEVIIQQTKPKDS